MKSTNDRSLPVISDQQFAEELQASRPCTLTILKAGPNFETPGSGRDPAITALIMHHGRRNMALRVAGLLLVVCPIGDGTGICRIGVFDPSPDQAEPIMSQAPAVMAGVFAFEIHASRRFPGARLP